MKKLRKPNTAATCPQPFCEDDPLNNGKGRRGFSRLSNQCRRGFEWGILLCLVIMSASYQVRAQIPLYFELEKNGFLACADSSFLFVDSARKVPLQAIPKQKFVRLNDLTKPQSFSEGYRYDYWLKLSIHNPTKDTLDLLFTAGLHRSVVMYRDIYNQLIELQRTNEKYLPGQRLFRYDDQYIPIRFLPGAHYQLYVKVNDYPKKDFALTPKLVSYLWENNHKVKAFYDEYIYLINNGVIISILLFVALFVLTFYILDRQKYYLYYGFYTASLALFNLWEYEHSPYFHILFSYLPFLKYTGNSNMYILLTQISYFLFVYEFLELKEKYPVLGLVFRRVIRTLIVFLILDVIVLFVFRRLDWSDSFYWLFQGVFPILNIILLVLVFRIKGRIARNIKIGSTFLVSGAFVGFMTQWFSHESYIILRIEPSIVFTLGTLIEIFFFSIAIGSRSYQIQKEQNSLFKAIKESELRTLRSQINPHFVFNSLNSIKSYILTHRSLEAAEYLTDFSMLMRSILQHSKDQLISLTDELETAVLYVKLEKLRFEDNFEFIYESDQSIDTDEILTPPMLLQPYIENAIKHGLMNKHDKRVLELKIRQLTESIEIMIEDNGIGREQASLLRKNIPKYQSMGMNINEERIKLLSQANDLHIQIMIEDKKSKDGTPLGTKVTIHIPLAPEGE
ncbi:histidine kinase [Emticicia sp. BO119]|uniref:histidine kinase n=1 Tax=Emticicia sp. BO119 TaxID=2757768 RepID=UPI0015EFEF07|nr:histidine kinase [Emticicia sp. BO119]MBA4851438.1 histidine kinase [Emticicia sp. BO119]